MKKLLIAGILCTLVLAGCGKDNDSGLINRDYTIDTKETQDNTKENSTENNKNTEPATKDIAQTSDDRFAYKIVDGIMDFDSVKGPYYIISISDMKVLDCTDKSGKIVSYSYDGSVLTMTLYSNEHPVNETYVIDTAVKSMGTLPVS